MKKISVFSKALLLAIIAVCLFAGTALAQKPTTGKPVKNALVTTTKVPNFSKPADAPKTGKGSPKKTFYAQDFYSSSAKGIVIGQNSGSVMVTITVQKEEKGSYVTIPPFKLDAASGSQIKQCFKGCFSISVHIEASTAKLLDDFVIEWMPDCE